MSKFGERKTERGGVLYDSALEAATAGLLDTLKRATKDSERVVEWKRQVKYNLEAFSPVSPNHKQVIGRYTPDFKVTFADGREELWEVKSGPTRTEAYRLRVKIFRANYPNVIHKEITKKDIL